MSQHPHDIISQTIAKIDFLTALIIAEHSPVKMSEPIRTGYYFTFSGISDDLALALNKLEVPK